MPPLSKQFGFGVRGDIPANAEESRIIQFILSTSTKDRHGTVLNQKGWDLENYKRNPIVAYQHNLSGGMCSDPNPDFVIGKSVKIGTEGKGDEKMLIADAQFEPAEVNPMAEKIFRKLLFGSLSRTSVGFLEKGHGQYGVNDEAEGRDNETYYFEGQELLEYSIVNIPSNPDAGKRGLDNALLLRRMREEGYVQLMYAMKELGGRFRLSQIEQLRICDVLTLLDGKDLEINETDPDRVRILLAENAAMKDQITRLKSYIKNQ
jgi:hypothetical protein